MLIYRKRERGDEIEVRSAGEVLRLYVNGILHTQMSPRRVLTGDVCDCLALPSLCAKPLPRRVLLLGLGGGAVVHILCKLIERPQITAVEMSRTLTELAHRYFGINRSMVTACIEDARSFVTTHREARFDLVIDDLFEERDGQPERSVRLTRSWCRKLASLVNPTGVLVVNCPTKLELEQSPLVTAGCTAQNFAARFRLSARDCENAVGVFCKQSISASAFRHRVRRHPALGAARERRAMSFRVHRLDSGG